MRRTSLALCLVALAGCSERRFAGPPPAESAGASSLAMEDCADASPPAAGGLTSWRDAVRLERWAEAAALLDALPEPSRARPEIRYVRARAALGTGDGARAVTLLEGLEAALPLLASDIAHWRAEGQLIAGPFAAAAAYFTRSSGAHDLTRAAGAYQKAGDLPSARAAADRAVAAAARAKSLREEIAARMKRAEIAQAQSPGGDDAAEPDLRWVATRATGTTEGRAAAEALDRMKRLPPNAAPDGPDPAPASPPTLPASGAVTSSSRPAASHPAPRPSLVARPVLRGPALHERAMALFRAREYTDAARSFREAAAAGSGHEPEDLHYAGRSLARADHDEEAVKVYREVAARYPRSPFAEKSSYQAARLDLQDARFKDAALAYTRYLATYPQGEHHEEAEYERALAWLSSGDAAPARAALEGLARKARDDRAARLRELLALAMDRAGDHPAAIALWTELAQRQPLTWAALTARARLDAAGAPLPPLMASLIPPAPTPQTPGSGPPEPDPKAIGRSTLDLRLPPTSALLASLGLDGDAESHLLSEEREAAAPYAGRESEALCGLYGLLSRAKRRYRVGINAVDGSSLLRAPSPAERWAWDCVYPRPFAGGVRALEEELALPRGLVYAVMRQESGFDPAIVSPASAVGLMQLMPATAKQAAGELSLPFDEADLTRPDYNLRIGAFYIAKLLKMFQGHVVLAAAAYNAGPRAVSRWIESSADRDLDLWVARIPFDETRNYVAHVAQNLARYQWLEGGDSAVTPMALTIPESARAPADAY